VVNFRVFTVLQIIRELSNRGAEGVRRMWDE
jgi:hypothetical protein